MQRSSLSTDNREDPEIEQSLVSCFETVATRHRDRLAVRDAKHSFSYGELNALADGVAQAIHQSRDFEVGAVILLLGQGALVPVAVLGVLKAACFYVTLDPDHPHDRNKFILGDSGARLILTDRNNQASAASLAAGIVGSPTVLVIEDLKPVGNRPDLNISPHDMCCIVYTSGSTGTPKGVCQVHRNIVHSTMIYRQLAGITCEDRFSLLQLMNVNAGSNAFFGALLNGAALFPFRVQQGLQRLAEYVDEERITCLHTAPTLFRHLANYINDVSPGRRFMHVRLLRLGGETITGADWLYYTNLFSETCKLFAGLGSAEGLNLRRKLYGRDETQTDEDLPLGDPVPGTEIFLADENGVPVKNGEIGRIVVRSDYQFPGYWRRDDLTREVLLPDPQDPTMKLFHTSDLARFSPDGRLFYAGRADLQVKIGGIRIEISGIESVLRQIPRVRDAAVIMLEQAGNAPHLVAFVIVTPSWAAPTPTPESMGARLRAALPENHVPSAFVKLDTLPLLPGGKIDRKALEARAAGTLRTNFVGKGNPIEEALAGMIQKVLGAPLIGMNDNIFLQHGCDSMAAVQILLGVARLFERELPLNALYEAPTVAALGQRLLDVGWRPSASGLLSLHQTGTNLPLFGVCGAFGHAFRLLLIGEALGEQQPFHALQPPEMDWSRVGCSTMEEMAAHYISEIRRIQPHGPYHLLGTSFGGIMMFEIALQLQHSGEEVALLVMVDTRPPDCHGSDWSDTLPPVFFPPGNETGIIGMGLRVGRAHRAAKHLYALRHSSKFKGQIIYFHCEDPPVPAASDRRLLWGHFATGGQKIIPVPGRHGTFHREPQFSAVVKELRTTLELTMETL